MDKIEEESQYGVQKGLRWTEWSQHAVATKNGVILMPCSMIEMLIKWRSLSRLETRTKESNVYASIRVANPECAMKVIGGNP